MERQYESKPKYIVLWLILGMIRLLGVGVLGGPSVAAAAIPERQTDTVSYEFTAMPPVMPGTSPLTWEGDVSARMLDEAHLFIDKKLDEAVGQRGQHWKRDFGSKASYQASVEPNRKRLMASLGVEDRSEPYVNYNTGLEDKRPAAAMDKIAAMGDTIVIAETQKYVIYQVKWPVLNRVTGVGLLIQPKGNTAGCIIAIPDADQKPEQLIGLAPGVPPVSQFARHLAENGFMVLVPLLISRDLLFPGTVKQQTFRERIYRQAFHMGRHIIGYEVEKIRSAIDYFKQALPAGMKIGVAGYGEGGLLALYSAAIDSRIDAAFVSGYFDTHQNVWDEPLYRNIFGLLSEFGDAELASLIAPRPLVIEYSKIHSIRDEVAAWAKNPYQVNGFPFTGYKGQLQTLPFASVSAEYRRIEELVAPGFQTRYMIAGEKEEPLPFGSAEALTKFATALGGSSPIIASDEIPTDRRRFIDLAERQLQQAKELEDHVQWLMRVSDDERNAFFLHKAMPEWPSKSWSSRLYHPYQSPKEFIETTKRYRRYFLEEILGRFDDPLLPPQAKTRKLYDRERWTGYEVELDVYPHLFAAGILLIPKDLQPGEKRPVVVTQHGRSGIPHQLVEGNHSAYNDVAARLADQGFVVYAPYNPYRGEDRYRWLDRKANALGKTLFSFIVSQHEQTLNWLSDLAFVDAKRIGFYGISYGGEAAMRLPAVLDGYSVSICSGDFGDWTRKVTDAYYKGSFINTLEWEMPYFNMGNTFSYAEMAYLIFPRPFMVERGHDDLVQPDAWVGYEFAKVKYLYDQFNLGDKTCIEYFNGGHSMKSVGSFAFLHKHLNWP